MPPTRKRRRYDTSNNHAQPVLTPNGLVAGGEVISPPSKEVRSNPCSRCASINLSSASYSTPITTSPHGFPVAQLGDIDDTWKSSPCSTCQFLEAVRPGDTGPYDLYQFPSHVLSARPGWRIGQKKIAGLEQSSILAVIRRRYPQSVYWTEIQDGLQKTGYIAAVAPATNASSTKLNFRLIDRDRVDFDLITSWLTFCQTHHTRKCGTKKFPSMSGLKLIDCKDRCVVPAKPDTRYLALSYVRGSNTGDESLGADNKLPTSIPLVIEDAISVTLGLKYRYLWVDRYCISQHDEEEKKDHFFMMGYIYKRAQATIVAAAGQDVDFGLPGVSTCPRKGQPYADVGNSIFCSSLPNIQDIVKESKWMSCGWTLQEFMLSRRLIIFTESQVYFECKGMHCCETIDYPLLSMHAKSHQHFQNEAHPGLLESLPSRETSTDMWKTIVNYTKRDLTNDADSLNAILGLLKEWRDASEPIHQFWGVPLLPPCFWTVKQSPVQKPGFHSHGFANALLWYHESPARRRHGFPSWTWAGWDGRIAAPFGCPEYRGCTCEENDIVIHADFKDSVPSDEAPDSTRLITTSKTGTAHNLLSPIIKIKSSTVTLRFVHLPEGVKMRGWSSPPGYYATKKVDTATTQSHGTLESCTMFALLCLSTEVDEAMHQRLMNEEWVGMLLHCPNDKERDVERDRILVVDASGDIAQRVGVIDMHLNSFISGLLPGQAKDGADGKKEVREQVMCNNGNGIDSWEFEKVERVVQLG